MELFTEVALTFRTAHSSVLSQATLWYSNNTATADTHSHCGYL